jgi:cyclopropane fatty-acyl-phospholipid synthase-like methyltransferase
MPEVVPADRSNGYEVVAAQFMSSRENSAVGATTVLEWARSLPEQAAVLDLGCGHGVPISGALIAQGMTVYGVDASPTMLAAFRTRFPDAIAECSAVEDSEFFGRSFDAVVAWGLMFLLSSELQALLVAKVAAALKPGGRFLFTSPRQPCEWSDNLTGRRSVSLGEDAYRGLAEAAGLNVVGNTEDEGANYYFFIHQPGSGQGAV